MLSSPSSPSSLIQQHHQQQLDEYEQALQVYQHHVVYHDEEAATCQQQHQQYWKAAHVLQRMGDVLSADHRADYGQAIRCYEMAEGLYQYLCSSAAFISTTTPSIPITKSTTTCCLPRIICDNLQRRALLHAERLHQIPAAIECHEEVVAMLLLLPENGAEAQSNPTESTKRGVVSSNNRGGVLSESMRVELITRSLQQLGHLYLKQNQQQQQEQQQQQQQPSETKQPQQQQHASTTTITSATSMTTNPSTMNVEKLALGAWEEALNVLQTALGSSTSGKLPKRTTPVRLIWQERLGQILVSLSQLYQQRDEWRRAVDALQDAINLQTRCWKIQVQKKNTTDANTSYQSKARDQLDSSIEAMKQLAQQLESLSLYDLCVACWEKMVLVQSQVLGDHHLYVAHSMYQLARVMLLSMKKNKADDKHSDDSEDEDEAEEEEEEEARVDSILDLLRGAYFIYYEHSKRAKLDPQEPESIGQVEYDDDLLHPSAKMGAMRTLLQLAKLLMEYGQYEDAISSYQQLLEAVTMTSPPFQVVASTSFILTELGRACMALEQYSVARQCFLQALRSTEKHMPSQHTDEEYDSSLDQQQDGDEEDEADQSRCNQIERLLSQADNLLLQQALDRENCESDDDDDDNLVFDRTDDESSNRDDDDDESNASDEDESIFAENGDEDGEHNEIHLNFPTAALHDVFQKKNNTVIGPKMPAAMAATAAVTALRSKSRSRLLERRWTEDDSESQGEYVHTTATTSPDVASVNSSDEEEDELHCLNLDTPSNNSCSLGLSEDTRDDKWLLAFIGADHSNLSARQKALSPDLSGYHSYAGSESSSYLEEITSPQDCGARNERETSNDTEDLDSLSQLYKAHHVELTGLSAQPFPLGKNLIDDVGTTSATESLIVPSTANDHSEVLLHGQEFSLFLATTTSTDERDATQRRNVSLSLLTDGDVLNSSAISKNSSSIHSSPRKRRAEGSMTSVRTSPASPAEKRPPYQRLTSAKEQPNPTSSPKKRLVKAIFPFRLGKKKDEPTSPSNDKNAQAPVHPSSMVIKPNLRRSSSGNRPPLSTSRADFPQHPSMSSRSEPGVVRLQNWAAGDEAAEGKSPLSPTCPPSFIVTGLKSWDDNISQVTFVDEESGTPQQSGDGGQWWWGVSLVSSLHQVTGAADGFLSSAKNSKTKKLPFSFDSEEESNLFEFSETNSQTQDSDSDSISLLGGNSVDSIDAIGSDNNSNSNRRRKWSPSSKSSERPNFLKQLRELRRASMQHPRSPLAERIRNFEGSITNQKQQLGANNPNVAGKLLALSRLHSKNRNLALAIESALEALRIYKSCGSLVEASKVLHTLAELYSQQKQYQSALSCYIEAHRLEQKELGYFHSQTATTLNRIGNLYSKQGEFDLAMEQHQKALTILKECFGEELKNPLVSQTLIHIGAVYYRERNSLSTIQANMDGYSSFIETGMLEVIGRAHEDRGSYRMAIAFFEEKLQLLTNRDDPNRDDIADTLYNLGRLSCKAGLYIEAMDYYDRALEKQLQLGCAEVQLASSRVLTGMVEYHMGQYAKALKLMQEALVVLRTELGSDHETVATTLYHIGVVQIALYQYEAAMQSLGEALDIQTRILGGDDPATLLTRREIARIRVTRDKDVNATTEQLSEVFETQRRVHGDNHPNIADTLYCMGCANLKRGDLEAALQCFEKCYYMQLEFLGEDHPQQSTALHAIARVQLQRGAVKKAMHILETVLANRKDALGERHVDVATALSTKAACLVAKGDFTEARHLFLEAKSILEATLGDSHPLVGELYVAMGTMHLRKCHFEEATQSIQKGLDIFKAAKLTDHHLSMMEARSLMDRVNRDEMLCV